jgi:hypothetical protein
MILNLHFAFLIEDKCMDRLRVGFVCDNVSEDGELTFLNHNS